ncbi:16S rRNA (cytosine(967)-C(5))-methyltransferase RsmB [Thalassobacillus sp. CUG 92003]|uniref:16S rRNA (cytosine(967)-C(5))-methyltransferase RsmB n=1 Tax=Thalassobacillus sp. CUG 92003 TaxID=2736641 RepID=UPI0015E76D68|nr:16S rRNA (cytosine(967)-C(5))-methyltransferase RsmB [Thalassobacillus sp. CUG 92003]
MSSFTLRETALDILTKIGDQGGFSHVLIDQAMHHKGLSDRDGALLTEIVYGTLQRRDLIEFYTAPFITKQKKLHAWVKWLLYMSVYQMKFLDKVPDHAIIHEAVNIAKDKGHKGVASLVNGVLRNIQRKGVPSLETIEDPVERLAIETSHPRWMIQRWIGMYGFEVTERMAHANIHQKPAAVRIQPLKIDREEAMRMLQEDGFEVTASQLSPQGIVIDSGNILKHPLFSEGKLTIQDQSSMLVAELMDLGPGLDVLDACSAPGGKTTHMAELMHDKGHITAYDLHSNKAKMVEEKAVHLNLTTITASQADSRHLQGKHSPETFDRILIDAPCSGLGVLRSKPDIKYHKSEKDIEALSVIQGELLKEIAPLLKPGGKLVYSTCTVDRAENENVIGAFLEHHQDFEMDQAFFHYLPEMLKNSSGQSDVGLQIFPYQFDSDGFFLTRLQKR